VAGRLSRVVLARPSGSVGLVDLDGVRWEVERSRAGVTVVGGVGAGRYELGLATKVTDDAWEYCEFSDCCFLGGGGGDR